MVLGCCHLGYLQKKPRGEICPSLLRDLVSNNNLHREGACMAYSFHTHSLHPEAVGSQVESQKEVCPPGGKLTSWHRYMTKVQIGVAKPYVHFKYAFYNICVQL